MIFFVTDKSDIIFFLWTQNSWKSRTFWQPMRYFIFSLNSKVKNPWKSFWQWKNFVFTHTSIILSYKRSYTSSQSRDLNTKPKKDFATIFFFSNWNPVFMYIFVYYHCNVIKKSIVYSDLVMGPCRRLGNSLGKKWNSIPKKHEK